MVTSAMFCILTFVAAINSSLFFIAYSRNFRKAVSPCLNEFSFPLKPENLDESLTVIGGATRNPSPGWDDMHTA